MSESRIYAPHSGEGAGLGRHAVDPRRCHIGVWSGGRWSTYAQCSRRGLYAATVEGKPVKVCAIHHPDNIAKREAEKQARYDKQTQAWDRQHKRPHEYREALRSIAAGHNDPRSLALETLEKWEDQ